MKTKLIPLLVIPLLTSPALAQSTWTGAAGNWSSNANPGWNGTGVPNAVDATADAQAAGGTITVNGTFSLGSITQLGTAARSLNTSTGGLLIFDVSSGNALWDMRGGLSGAGTSGGITHSTNIQLNDNTEIRGLVSTSTTTPVLTGKVSGTGQLILTNVATTPTASGIRFDLRNTLNDFSGGISIGQGVALRLNASGAAGTGAIVRTSDPAAGTSSINFRNDLGNTSQTYANNINFGSNVSGGNNVMAFDSAGMTITLNGILSGSMGNTGRTSLNGGTLILGGTTGANTWTGVLRTGNNSTVIADKVSAINNGISLRGQTDGTSNFLVGVTDTITGQISADGNDSGAGAAYLARIGLKDGNSGTLIINNANKINLANTWGIGGTGATATTTSLNLHSGNGSGVLEVLTEIGQNSDARSISISGSGTVNLARSAGMTYTGSTSVLSGNLAVNNATNSATGPGAVNVFAGAKLSGTGRITGAVSMLGDSIIAPGNSAGTLTTGTLTLQNTTNLNFELTNGNFTIGTGVNDLLTVNGDLTLDGILNITALGGTLSPGTYRLINYTGALTNNTLDISSAFLTTNPGSSINTGVSGQVNLVVVPEPGAAMLIATSLGAVLLRRRRRTAA